MTNDARTFWMIRRMTAHGHSIGWHSWALGWDTVLLRQAYTWGPLNWDHRRKFIYP